MRIDLLFAFLLITGLSYSQTTIIVRKEKDKIIAVADTKLGYLGSSKTDTMEKIGVTNNICFAVGGIFFRENYNAALESCKKANTFQQAIDSFFAKRFVEIRKQFDTLKATSLEYYQKYMHQPGSTVIFFGYENKKYKIAPITFILPQTLGKGESAVGALTVPYSYGGACNYDTITYTYGFLNAISDSVCLDVTWQQNPEETAIRLLRKQIHKTPEFVGSPITIVTIRKKKIIKRRIDE